MIPILWQHDKNKIVGEYKDGDITFLDGYNFTKELIEDCFGHIGYEIIESESYGSLVFIKKLRILEYSIIPKERQ